MNKFVVPHFLMVVLWASGAWAAGITYQGRIIRPDGIPLEAPNVTVTVQISSAGAENCLLFQETHTFDMRGTNGIFSIIIGQGVRASSSIDGGFSLPRIFANDGKMLSPLPTCTEGDSYTAGGSDTRRLTIAFNDGSGVQTLQAQNMNFVPFAVEAKQVSGYGIDSLLRVDGVTAPAFDASEFGELRNLIAGSSDRYTKANELGGTALPALSIGDSLRWNGSGWEAMTAGTVVNSITAGTGLDAGAGPGGTITSSGTLNLSDTGVTAGTYGDAVNIPRLEVDAQGRLTNVANVPLTTVADFSGSLAGDVSGTQGATRVDRIKGISVSPATPLAGQVLRHDGVQWAPTVPNFVDLKNAVGGLQFPTNCSTTQVMIYSSVSDSYECQNITLANTSDVLGGDVTGSIAVNTVVKLRNRDVASTIPNVDDVLKWNGSAWAPARDEGSDAVINGGNAGAVTVGTNNATSLAFRTNGATAVTILSGGNVGVGTASPAEKLEVSGRVKATAICIAADCRSAWPSANVVFNLYGGAHTNTQCESAGGLVRSIGGSSFLCQFTGASCPGGWARLSNWGVTHPTYGTSCSPCLTSSHEWSNAARETCNIGYWIDGGDGPGSCYPTGGGTVSAKQVAVGCY